MSLDDTDEWFSTKFKTGEQIRYVGCLSECDCKNLPEDIKAELAMFLPGKLHFGREGPVQMCGHFICKMEVGVGTALIAHIDHFEAVDVR